ncbi:MAG: hypothetical protein Q7W05_06300 [Deltaproteobacteria bacterium]|nr:hypothetical protein [Deltaproteobacteria bacterium]
MMEKILMEEFWVVGPAGADLKTSLMNLAQQNQLAVRILEEDGHLNRKKLRFTVSGPRDGIGSFHQGLSQEPDIKFVGLGV